MEHSAHMVVVVKKYGIFGQSSGGAGRKEPQSHHVHYTIEEAFWHVYDFLLSCTATGIILKAYKNQFALRLVGYTFFRLSSEKYKPTKNRLAVNNFFLHVKKTLHHGYQVVIWFCKPTRLLPCNGPDNDFWEIPKRPTGTSVYWDGQQLDKPRTPNASSPSMASWQPSLTRIGKGAFCFKGG